jgi:hypothetical protein
MAVHETYVMHGVASNDKTTSDFIENYDLPNEVGESGYDIDLDPNDPMVSSCFPVLLALILS